MTFYCEFEGEIIRISLNTWQTGKVETKHLNPNMATNCVKTKERRRNNEKILFKHKAKYLFK